MFRAFSFRSSRICVSTSTITTTSSILRQQFRSSSHQTSSSSSSSPSQNAMKSTKGLMQERKQMAQDSLSVHEEGLRRRGINIHARRDLIFDSEIDGDDDVNIINRKNNKNNSNSDYNSNNSSENSSTSRFSLKMTVTKPKKPVENAKTDRLQIKPGQKFDDAVQELVQRKEKQDHEKNNNKTTKFETFAPTPTPTTTTTSSMKIESKRFCSSSTSSSSPPQAAPPLPSMQQSAGAAPGVRDLNNPSDDDICYHLRAVIERSATKVSADITTLQLALTGPMMDALAKRHGSSLRVFLSKFPGRFRADANQPSRVFLFGISGSGSSAASASINQQQKVGTSNNDSNNNSSSETTMNKPLHPSQIRATTAPPPNQQHQQQQQQRSSSSSSSSSSVPQAAPPLPFGGGGANNNKNLSSHPPPKNISSEFAPPSLPPLPGKSGGAFGGGGGGSSSGQQQQDAATAPGMSVSQQHLMETAFMTKSWRSPADIVDTLMEYIPSYWIPMRHVHNQLPYEIKELYQNKMRLNQFLKKFSYYFDSKITPRGAEIKVRDDCKHQKKGEADDRYAQHQRQQQLRQQEQQQMMSSGSGSSSKLSSSTMSKSRTSSASSQQQRYVDVDAHSLAGQLRQLCSNTTFMNIKEFQNSLPGTLTNHPEYDSTVGVLPTLEKNPFIFQVADGSVRLRQKGVAPNALDAKGQDEQDSPLPHIFAKILNNFVLSADEVVDVASILAKLTLDERDQIKKKYRSLPRFLRSHGAAFEVSRDNTTVRRWEEPRNASAGGGSSGDIFGSSGSGGHGGDILPETEEDPNEPKISDGAEALPKGSAASAAAASAVQWALKELYSMLPLSTCVELDDAISMLPSQMRDAASTCPDLVKEMERYPDYFTVWNSPDNKKMIIVQRSMIGPIPELDVEEVLDTAASLIPQGGIACEKLMRRMPPKMQRYLFKHGLKKTLMSKPREFLIVGQKVLFLGERE